MKATKSQKNTRNMSNLITVIVPVRNGAEYVSKAIESVLMQTVGRLQLIVSDNGSTDDTLSILTTYGKNPRVKLVKQIEPFDMFGHFNKCLTMVDTKYFMMLHHDDCLRDPGALQKAFVVLESHPDISVVYSDMAYVDKIGKLINFRSFDREGVVESDGVAKKSVVSVRNLFGVPLLIRADSVGRLKYDSSLNYAADLDFSIALSSHGFIYHIKEPLIAYRIHGKNATVSLFKFALMQMMQIAQKHGIALSRIQKFAMGVNAWKVAVQKWIFFQYLEKMRKY